MSRIDPIMKRFIGNESADDLATDILEVLTEGSNVPQAGNYYVFVYQAKTPGIAYDSHPLVAVTDVFSWGFRGTHFHHGDSRSYSFSNIVGSTYRVYPEELTDLQALPFGRMRLNS